MQEVLDCFARRWRRFAARRWAWLTEQHGEAINTALQRVGIEARSSVGLLPSLPPWQVVYNVLRHRKIGGFRISPRFKPLTYAGYGYKSNE